MRLDFYSYRVKYLTAYDGDTIRVDIDLGFNFHKKNMACRLYGINSPEVRGEQREAGLITRDYVRDVLGGSKEVAIKSIKDQTEKYGRTLAIVFYVDNQGKLINLNADLVEKGLADLYMLNSLEDLEHTS